MSEGEEQAARFAGGLLLARRPPRRRPSRAPGAAMSSVAGGRPQRLLVAVFVTASLVTAVLSLDATDVLLVAPGGVVSPRLTARWHHPRQDVLPLPGPGHGASLLA